MINFQQEDDSTVNLEQSHSSFGVIHTPHVTNGVDPDARRRNHGRVWTFRHRIGNATMVSMQVGFPPPLLDVMTKKSVSLWGGHNNYFRGILKNAISAV